MFHPYNMGKEPESLREILEEGNFIAPPGGDPRDEESIPKLRRAVELICPGLVMAAILPNVIGDGTFLGSIGAVLVVFGTLRLWDEGIRFRLVLLCAALQGLSDCFRFVGANMWLPLMESPLYPAAGVVAVVAGTATPVLLAVALGTYHRKSAPWMAGAALAAVVLLVLKLVGAWLILRAALAVLGTAALAVLFVRAKRAPMFPT